MDLFSHYHTDNNRVSIFKVPEISAFIGCAVCKSQLDSMLKLCGDDGTQDSIELLSLLDERVALLLETSVVVA